MTDYQRGDSYDDFIIKPHIKHHKKGFCLMCKDKLKKDDPEPYCSRCDHIMTDYK